MGSAIAMWAYQRRLSLDARRISMQELELIHSEKPGHRRTLLSRTDSGSSVPPEDKRVSIDPNDDSGDDEYQNHQSLKDEEAQQRKLKRRFSLEFLFPHRKGKDKQKNEKKRAQSISVPENDSENSKFKEFRTSGVYNSDFAVSSFI